MSGGFKMADAYVEVTADTTKAEKEASGLGAKIGKGLGAGMAAAGAGAAGLLAKGFADNMNIEVANDKLRGQLGLTQADAEKAGRVSGEVYRANWGGSIEEVNAAIKGVSDNLGSVADTSEADLQQMTSAALALASTFDVDVSESTKAAGALIKNGLAANSTEAFDIITAGMQSGVDKSGDFLDTLNEYSPQFAKLGISGTQALGILQDGLKAGARDTDVIADAFKEFSIRSIDGSKLTAEGFKLAGLDAKTMAAEIAKGGDSALGATQQTLEGLLAIKDPQAQNTAGVALFGTQWEDTVRGILPAMASMADASDTTQGSTQLLMDTVGDNAQGKIDSLKRGFEGWTQSMASSNGPLGLVTTGMMTFGGTALTMGGSIGQIVAGLGTLNGALILEKAGLVASTAAKGIAAAATGVWTGAQWLLNAALTANPIGIVIVVIAALVAAIVIAYKNSETFRNIVTAALDAVKAAFGWMGDKAQEVFTAMQAGWTSFTGFLSGVVTSIGGFLSGIWDGITSAFTATITWITTAWAGFTGWVSSMVTAMATVLSAIWDGIKTAFTTVTGWVTTAWDAYVGVWRTYIAAFTTVLSAIWDGIKVAFTTVTGWVTTAWNAYVGVIQGIITRVSGIVGKIWDSIKTGFTTVKSWVTTGFDNWINLLGKLGGRIKSATSGMFNGIKDAFRSAINWVISGWNGLHFGLPSFTFAGITTPGFNVSVPRIPSLAEGGLVMPAPGGQIVRIAEAGRPEAVIPLDKLKEFGGGGRGTTIENLNINITGSLDMASEADRLRVVRQLRDELVKLEGSTR